MYNQERKEQYLSERELSAPTSINNIRNAFDNTESFEEMYGRDVCEWSTKEIIEFYKYLDCKSVSRLIVLNSILFIYTNWCMNQLLVSDNQNHFSEIDTRIIGICINKLDLDNSVIDRETLLLLIQQLPNPCDQFLLLGLFEGFSGPNHVELSKFQYSDIDIEKSVANVSTGRTIPISRELINIAHEAKESTIYISMDRDGSKSYAIEPIVSDIFKSNLRSRNYDEVNLGRLLLTRYLKCLDFLGLPRKMKMKDLSENGRIYLINKLADEYHVSGKKILTNEYRHLHEDIYGKIQSVRVFLIKYEKFLKT